jgi:uncharacterized membrane protein/mono/diheme cytochrome c family protein
MSLVPRRSPQPPLPQFAALAVAFLAFAGLAHAAGAAGGGGTKIFRWRPFLAPFHAVVLHLPIGFLTMAVILEIYRHFHPSAELKRVTKLVLWSSLVSGMVAAALGILRATSGGYEVKALSLHRWLGMAVPIATLFTLAFQRVAYRNEHRLAWTSGYRGLLGVTFALLVVAGHYGGNLTHGSTYLTENAPEFVRELLEETTSATPAEMPAGALDEKQKLFVERVQPVLTAKCVRCHGPEKQKGGYRLDASEFALKAGESEKPAIVPGDPWKSHLVHLVSLPPGNEEIMPPEGKEPLTPEEIGLVVHWIRVGAPFAEPAKAPPSETNHTAVTR